MLSKKCSHGLRGLLQLATSYQEDPALWVKTADLAGTLNIPSPTLGKVLHEVAEQGFIESHKGPGGGVRLQRPPENIPVLDIIAALDGPDPFHRCIMGYEECSNDHPCPLHRYWHTARQPLLDALAETTLNQLRTADLLPSPP